MKLRDFFRWSGEINRITYLSWGVLFFALKYNIDRLLAFSFGRSWYFYEYYVQADQLALGELSPEDRMFYLYLLALSLPFICLGTVLTVKRLRSAKLPTWLVTFFFIPFVNLVLFTILAAIPERKSPQESSELFWAKFIPNSAYGSALLALGSVLLLSLLMTLLFVNYLNEYGWSLFVGIPFYLGFGSVYIYGYKQPVTLGQALGVAFTTVLFFSGIIFILAFEGLICLAMAFPLLLVIAWIGATVGYAVQRGGGAGSLQVFTAPICVILLFGFVEAESDLSPPLFSVVTEVSIQAPPQAVWDQLVAFSHIEEPEELLFQTGIAYPIHAEIEGVGLGAIRHCNFTTGAFVEPITKWEEPYLLEFSVAAQPPPMVEWSIYEDMHMEHVEGYFRSEKGQFYLEVLPDGRTLLRGTTWYRHDIWPTFYWRLWSDYILHQIHLRVLNHIKQEAEW